MTGRSGLWNKTFQQNIMCTFRGCVQIYSLFAVRNDFFGTEPFDQASSCDGALSTEHNNPISVLIYDILMIVYICLMLYCVTIFYYFFLCTSSIL